MKKLITTLLLLSSITSYAYADGMSVVAMASSAMASANASSASRQAINNQNYAASSGSPAYFKGAMHCETRDTGKGITDYNSCKYNRGLVNIQDFFNANKPSWASEIVMVVMDSDNNFWIYYR